MARTPQAQRIEDAWTEVVESRTTRRELVKRTAVAGAALAGAGTGYIVTKKQRPGRFFARRFLYADPFCDCADRRNGG